MRKRLAILTTAAGAAFAVLLALGTWQVERLQWKLGLIAERKAALAAAPVALPRALADAQALNFHRVRASGVFVHEYEFYVNATERVHGHAGVLVVTPLRLDDGAVVLVERGFVPYDRKRPGKRAEGQLAGTVTVEGLLRVPDAGAQGWFVPPNDAERNQWFSIDIPAMAHAAGIDTVLPFYVEAGDAPNPGGYPIGGQARVELVNDHLQYAMTWYVLALALAVIYFILLRREIRARPESTGAP